MLADPGNSPLSVIDGTFSAIGKGQIETRDRTLRKRNGRNSEWTTLCSPIVYICTRAIHTDMRDLPPLQEPKEDPCPRSSPRPPTASLPARGQVSLPRGLASQGSRAIRVPITQNE